MKQYPKLDFAAMYEKIQAEAIKQEYKNITNFAEIAGLSQSPFTGMRKGGGITLYTAYVVCQALDKPLDWLVSG